MPDEPLASIVRDGLEGYASGHFASQSNVMRYCEQQPAFPKDLPNGKLRMFTVSRLLRKPVYAGYVEAPNWDVSLRKGQHEGLISFETYQKILSRLNENAYAPARKDISEDFPLRILQLL